MPQTVPVARSGVVALLVHEAHVSAPVEAYFGAKPQALEPQAFDRTLGERQDDTYYRVASGVALLPMIGPLIPRGLYLGGYATSYEALGGELRKAAADPAVNSIALLIDSPGGYVSGIDAAAAAIAAAALVKPVTAYVQGMACSAAYWLASQASEIVCTPLAELGSIGILQVHFDMSRMIEEIGIKVTLLHAGAKKVDGNEFEPLSDRVRAEMTAELEDLRMAFASAVAAGRAAAGQPAFDVAAALATEAATYRGPDAVARGLADRIGFIADDLPDTDDPLVASPLTRFLETPMKTYTQAQLDEQLAAARTEGHKAGQAEGHAAGKAEGHASGKAEGLAEGSKAGATAERERIKGIMGGEEAKGREDLAAHFAYETETPAASVVVTLSKAAKAVPAPAADTLDAEMARDRVPLVGADGQPIQQAQTDDEKKFAEGRASAAKLLGKKPDGK